MLRFGQTIIWLLIWDTSFERQSKSDFSSFLFKLKLRDWIYLINWFQCSTKSGITFGLRQLTFFWLLFRLENAVIANHIEFLTSRLLSKLNALVYDVEAETSNRLVNSLSLFHLSAIQLWSKYNPN